MLNREKYAKEIVEIACDRERLAISNGKPVACEKMTCNDCDLYDDMKGECHKCDIQKWANAEYVEPPIDWSKVAVDTPILVRYSESDTWARRYFAKYEDNTVYAWGNGTTSWSVPNSADACGWPYAKLAELANREQAEEQGLPLRLPCKVGDTVWVVTSPFNVFDDIEYDENMKDEVYEAFVSSVTFYKIGEQYRICAKVTNHFIGAYFRNCDFGKTVFLNREEAEAKLKEMEGANVHERD